MASFDFDQAEGLRRILAGPKPRVFTFLSATPDEEKSTMLVNLGASLAAAGSQAVLVDARTGSRGFASRLELPHAGTLLDVARQEQALNKVIHPMEQGFGVALLTRGNRRDLTDALDPRHARLLGNTFDLLAAQADIMIVDGELGADDGFPLRAMSSGAIVVQVSASAASITAAYSIIKRLNARLGRRPFGIVVTGATEREAQVVYDNMEKASNRYLAVRLNSLGSVPADEHVKRAARLGRSVVDAFPLAGASVAFRRLAGRVAALEMASVPRGMSAVGANAVV